MPTPPAVEMLGDAFGLSQFERSVLLMCAGMELEASFAELCARAHGDAQRAYPTFGLALAALPEPHWSALTPTAPLRLWRLIEVESSRSLVNSPLRIDERVLHYLTGVEHLDEHLIGFVEPVVPSRDLVPSHRKLAAEMAAVWRDAPRDGHLPVVQLCGSDASPCATIAAAACAMVGLGLRKMPADILPAMPVDFDTLMRLWQREAILSGSALLLDCQACEMNDASREALIDRALEMVGGVVVVTGRQRRRGRQRPIIAFEVDKPTSAEQRSLWTDALGESAEQLDGQVERLVCQFDLNGPVIASVCRRSLTATRVPRDAETGTTDGLAARLWQTCRVQARPRLDDLAGRVASSAGWDDLVLPQPQLATLRDIVRHVRHRALVYDRWGFAAKSSRGLGITALLAGSSGTGKTLAAEVLANELQLDLYRIDLSQVVSKYIGETEKNLRRVFDAADEGGAVLLFDEADALFGKRSEVKDSHDRYANIEISYLLQRMEAYRGLAILTTNMKNALDTAFLRRIRFIVQFPFPDAAQRAEIWRRVFPADTPTDDLVVRRLAQLNITGGSIRNIAMNAAFLAADDGQPVRMAHVLHAARNEYMKLEKSLTDVEIRGWT